MNPRSQLLLLLLSASIAIAQTAPCKYSKPSDVDRSSGVLVQTVTLSGEWGSNTATVLLPRLERLSEVQTVNNVSNVLSYYGYDGHGSVRDLTNNSGAVTDTYDYDAFGNLIASTGSTPNNFLFAGEQFDPNLGLYYNRARYLDVRSGRFWGMDSEDGQDEDPISLHRYLYTGDNPVNKSDPSGQDFIETINAVSLNLAINAMNSFPTITAGVILAVDLLTPVELQPTLTNGSILGGTTATILLEDAIELSTIARQFRETGGFARLGLDFESFILKSLPTGLRQVIVKDGKTLSSQVLGSARIDLLLDDVVAEVKLTGASIASSNQIRQIALFAKQTDRAIEYIFFKKPTLAQVEQLVTALKKVAPDIKVGISFVIP